MTETRPTHPAAALVASVYRFPGGGNVAVIGRGGQTLDRFTFDGDDVAEHLQARGYLATGAETKVAPNLGQTPLAACSECWAPLPPSAAGGDGRCAMC
jgi:hypothetical protein